MTVIEKVAKWIGTGLVAMFTAFLTIQVAIGVLQSDVATLKASAETRTAREFERDNRILQAIGDLKGEVGGIRTEMRLLKEQLEKGR